MTDYIRSLCPQCQHRLRIRREYVGRRIGCKECGSVFEIKDEALTPTGKVLSPESRLEHELLTTRHVRDRLQAELARIKLELAEHKENVAAALSAAGDLEASRRRTNIWSQIVPDWPRN